MNVGYARASSLAQVAGLEAQERELRAAGCDKLFREQVSSVAERQQLEAALDYVREGDTLVVTKRTGSPGRWATCWRSSPNWRPRGSASGSSQCPACNPSTLPPPPAG